MADSPIALSDTTASALLPDDAAYREMWKKLAAIAIADGIHDSVIVNTDAYGEKTGSATTAAKRWQCERFCAALPELAPAECNAAAASTGLLINDAYKRESLHHLKIEQNIFLMVSPLSIDQIITNTTPPAVALNTEIDLTTHNHKRYTVKTIQWGVGAVPDTDATVCGQGLMQNLRMRDGSALLVDAENNGIVKKFKQGGPSTWVLYFLMLPEYLADSAPRKRWKRSKMFTSTAGINWRFAGKYQAEYPPWTDATRNTFFSAYSCDMITNWTAGTCQQTWRLPGVALPVFDTTHAHRDNNKTNVINYNPADTVANANIISLKYQRKRSGDQLQALAVKRLVDGTTFRISTDGNNPPTATSNYNGQLTAGNGANIASVKGESYLMTHDQTLLAYALHLGINVIFTRSHGGTSTAISFKIKTTNLPAGAPAGTPPGNLNDNNN